MEEFVEKQLKLAPHNNKSIIQEIAKQKPKINLRISAMKDKERKLSQAKEELSISHTTEQLYGLSTTEVDNTSSEELDKLRCKLQLLGRATNLKFDKPNKGALLRNGKQCTFIIPKKLPKEKVCNSLWEMLSERNEGK